MNKDSSRTYICIHLIKCMCMHVYWNNTRTHILNTSSVNLIEFHQNNYYCTSIYYYRYYISVLRYVQYNCIKIYYWCTYIINCKQVNVYKTLLLEWSFRHVSIPQSQIYFEVMKNSSGWHLIPPPPQHTRTHTKVDDNQLNHIYSMKI